MSRTFITKLLDFLLAATSQILLLLLYPIPVQLIQAGRRGRKKSTTLSVTHTSGRNHFSSPHLPVHG